MNDKNDSSKTGVKKVVGFFLPLISIALFLAGYLALKTGLFQDDPINIATIAGLVLIVIGILIIRHDKLKLSYVYISAGTVILLFAFLTAEAPTGWREFDFVLGAVFLVSAIILQTVISNKNRKHEQKIADGPDQGGLTNKQREAASKYDYTLDEGEWEIDDDIDDMDGHAFEYWCADLLRKNGFTQVTVTPGSGDQGVDIIAVKDGLRYAIQCKRYNKNLGNKPVQEVNTGKTIYGCDLAAVMTNQYFTDSAIQAAVACGVLLWGRDELAEMMRSRF